MAVALHEAGAFAWPTFQAALIARIGAWEAAHPDGGGYSYYSTGSPRWRTCSARTEPSRAADVDARAEALAGRPAGLRPQLRRHRQATGTGTATDGQTGTAGASSSA